MKTIILLIVLAMIFCSNPASIEHKTQLKFWCSDSTMLPLDLYSTDDSLFGTINTIDDFILFEKHDKNRIIIKFSSVENLSIVKFPFDFLDNKIWKIDLYFIK